jgi:acyl carrier protein phosphodiesterase
LNYLAPCLIAAQAAPDRDLAPDLIAGGLLGDRVKGRLTGGDWPAPLLLGIRLHRRLDAYSNSHASIRASCDRFPPALRRLAPVFVDILADHVLTLEWPRWADVDLDEFARRSCAHALAHADRLDPPSKRWLAGIDDYRLLARYGSADMVERAFAAVTRRLGRSHLDPAAAAVLRDQLGGFRTDFASYFPDLVEHARQFIARAGTGDAPQSLRSPETPTRADGDDGQS